MLFQKEFSCAETFDLIVCGGGMSGIAAAIAAAKRGLKVAIVESGGCLGGVATSCGVNQLLGGRWYNEATGEMEHTVGGIFDYLMGCLEVRGAAINPDDVDVRNNPHGWYPRMGAGYPIDGERAKVVFEEECLKLGIRIYYFTTVLDVYMKNFPHVRSAERGAVSGYCASAGGAEERRIKGIAVHNKSGIFGLEARYFADCTGDSDVTCFAGCETVKGREQDGLTTNSTLIMEVDHVDSEAYVAYQNKRQSPKLVEIIERLKEEGVWTYPFEIFIAIRLVEKDVFFVNTQRLLKLDGTNGDDITRGMIEGRRINLELFEIMKKYFPGFENARIRKIHDKLGIRESRRIVGREHVTVTDALGGRHFDSCIASTTYNWDLPDPEDPRRDVMLGATDKPHAAREHLYIEIPYGALLPKGADNLIVAGRCVSVDREVLGPVRIMGPCVGMGEAAGTAAAIAAWEDIGFTAVDTDELRRLLREAGCLLPA